MDLYLRNCHVSGSQRRFPRFGQHTTVRPDGGERRPFFCQEAAGCWEGHRCRLKMVCFKVHVETENVEMDYLETIHACHFLEESSCLLEESVPHNEDCFSNALVINQYTDGKTEMKVLGVSKRNMGLRIRQTGFEFHSATYWKDNKLTSYICFLICKRGYNAF